MSDENEHDEGRKKRTGSDDVEDLKAIAEALPQLFDAINESLPTFIKNLIGTIYSPEAAGNMGKAVGQFYAELKAQGIPEDVALDMTKKFVSALDFSKILSMASHEIEKTPRPSPPIPPSPPKKIKERSSNMDDDEELDEEE